MWENYNLLTVELNFQDNATATMQCEEEMDDLIDLPKIEIQEWKTRELEMITGKLEMITKINEYREAMIAKIEERNAALEQQLRAEISELKRKHEGSEAIETSFQEVGF